VVGQAPPEITSQVSGQRRQQHPVFARITRLGRQHPFPVLRLLGDQAWLPKKDFAGLRRTLQEREFHL
jgi:hypothetical protein